MLLCKLCHICCRLNSCHWQYFHLHDIACARPIQRIKLSNLIKVRNARLENHAAQMLAVPHTCDDVFTKEALHVDILYTAMISCLFNFVNWHTCCGDKSENSWNNAHIDYYYNNNLGKICFNTDVFMDSEYTFGMLLVFIMNRFQNNNSGLVLGSTLSTSPCSEL